MSQSKTLTDQKRTRIFINIIVCCAAGSMLSTALNTALYPIISDFHISATVGQWMTSGYTLAMAIIMPLTAFLIHRFPTKRLYCSAITISIVGLVLCATAVNFPMMMVGRVIQAVGNGVYSTMGQVVILSIFPPEKGGLPWGGMECPWALRPFWPPR